MTSKPTRHQRDVFAEYLRHESTKLAAACLGLSESTVKNHLATLRLRLSTTSSAGAAVALGWLSVPANARHPEPPNIPPRDASLAVREAALRLLDALEVVP